MFEKRFEQFKGMQQQDAQEFLIFLLNCLHEDLNSKICVELPRMESMTAKSYETVRQSSIAHYNQHNSSIISRMFNGFHYQEIICQSCNSKAYHFENSFMIHVPVPLEPSKLEVYVVLAANLTLAKRMYVEIKDMERVGEVVDLVKDYLKITEESSTYLFTVVAKEWEVLDPQTDFNTLRNKTNCIFIYEVPNPTEHQEIAKITYHHRDKYKIGDEQDGFPRFMVIDKIDENDS
jgi:uncharacterized UBP type Zn finger protein